ncbi:MAG TPA: VOC family protein [Methylomirabilota bacterium]|nr:VOC family protein [Methylomirabilota bacterium]
MPTIVHFQIPSDDIERSKKFYNDLFGWKFDKFPSPAGSEAMPEGMEYWMISTVDDKGDEGVNGGMMKRQSPEQQGITNYFDVKSVQEYSAKVEQLGGIRCQVWVILLYVQIQRIMALVFLKRIKLLNE